VNCELTLDWIEYPLHPDAAGCAVRFDPNGASGDWIDVVMLGGSRLAVVVGDAMGWGRSAAPLAAMLGRAARLLLSSGATPSQVIGELDSLVGRLDDVIATAAVAVIDPLAGRVELACAGHPPPLVIPRCGGGASLLPCEPQPPLGMGESGERRPSRWTLPASVLFFYTDGLIDGRGRCIEAELTRLADGADCPDGDLSALCRRVIAAHVPNPPEDDVTVLAVNIG
jgi:serine phosphatase RsbU (regulator of sigma subunit)